MNRERIKRLRDLIASLPEHRFNMSSFGTKDLDRPHELWADPLTVLNTDCGTVACLAGWTCAMYAPETLVRNAQEAATHALDLDYHLGEELFRGNDATEDLMVLGKAEALVVLDRLLETGEVVWP